VDATLQAEGDEYRASAAQAKLGSPLGFYGASVGAVRGTIRDLARRHAGMSHDEITALSSELWAVPVFERRLAAVVLLQSNVALLKASDLTRLEGFVRESQLNALLHPLALDVIGPLLARLDGPSRARADVVLARWERADDPALRRAAGLAGHEPIR
jgi:hypothetical protein